MYRVGRRLWALISFASVSGDGRRLSALRIASLVVATIAVMASATLPAGMAPQTSAARQFGAVDLAEPPQASENGRRSWQDSAVGQAAPATLRYAFLVNWDPGSAASMRTHLGKIDVLVPEWLHLGEAGALLQNDRYVMAEVADQIGRSNLPVRVMPMINNYWRDGWQGERVDAVLAIPRLRSRLAVRLRDFAVNNRFHGITIDFQQFSQTYMEGYEQLVAELAGLLHAEGLALNVVIPLQGEQWRAGVLSRSADAVIVSAYDFSNGGTAPGPVAPQDWVASHLRARVAEAAPGSIVLGLANYGYDWREGEEPEIHTFGDVMLRARQAQATIRMDEESLNPTFEYYDIDNEHREVWYLDAVTAFNHTRAVGLDMLGGVALWRLGAEDPAIWEVFADLASPDPDRLERIDPGAVVDYHGEGEVLRLVADAREGHRDIEFDRRSGLIVDQRVDAFPSGYEIGRWGGGDHRKLVLTFDDGPDPVYTPQILDILKQYGVPAVFFVTGTQTNDHPRLAQRIAAEGHELGNHTFTHPNLDLVTDIQMRMELNATQRVIESVTGRATLLFRPPYATNMEPQTAAELRIVAETSRKGYFSVGMNVDSKDWWLARPQSIIDRVVGGVKDGQGHVILMHDAGGSRVSTVAALPVIIETLRAEGYEFVGIADLLGRTRDEIMPPVNSAINPLIASDALGYAIVRALHFLLHAAFMAAIALALMRAALILALSAGRRPSLPLADPRLRVGVIVPAYNEENVVCQTVRSLLQSHSQDFDILVVDDGSTDDTYRIALETFAGESRVRVVTKENGGKSEALNYGLTLLDHDIIVAMDADTIFLPQTIPSLVAHFSDPLVGAVAGNAKVGNRINLITRWQALEYIVAQNLDRRAFEKLNCITVVPGAVGAWRRDVVLAVGGFHSDTLAEDADLTIRVIRAGHLVVYEDRAIALTEAPADIRSFVKQRFRWTYGMMQTALKHLDALTRSKPNAVGLVALPNILLFQLLLPCLAPIADVLLVFGIVGAGFNSYFYPDLPMSEGLLNILLFYSIFIGVDFLVAAMAFLKERGEENWMIVLLLPQRFLHRQLLYFVVVKAILVALKGHAVGWYKVKRMASVQLAESEVEKPAAPLAG